MLRLLLVITLLSVYLTGCVNPRQLQYFQGSFDTTKLSTFIYKEPVIQQGDMINIEVYSDNPTASQYYNLGISNASLTTQLNGYLVDENGNIDFKGLGTIHVAGLTKNGLKDLLDKTFKDRNLLQNPHYNIRFLNYRITVLGDVGAPGVYSIPNERVNILEAIGLAGDITIFGRRNNVLIVRETNGKREWGRVDLTSPTVFNSPYYNLQQNDLVYVEPVKQKSTAGEQATVRNLGIVTTIASLAALLISILSR